MYLINQAPRPSWIPQTFYDFLLLFFFFVVLFVFFVGDRSFVHLVLKLNIIFVRDLGRCRCRVPQIGIAIDV